MNKFTKGPFHTHRAAQSWAEANGFDNYDLKRSGAKFTLTVYTGSTTQGITVA